jgi:hypothetical protein
MILRKLRILNQGALNDIPTYLQNSTFAQDAHSQRSKWFQLTNDTVTSLVLALASTALTDRELSEQNWIPAFQNFRVGNLFREKGEGVRYVA